ncbi:LemA family protein [Sediminicoccus sp. KRV36]|uniref:LemA family protein n=1 Tax=Sediminicoccus sp. KRV36 TaxID=3133721 RepID=UPI0020101CFC|nr:LemA family protein [Sediminicoccus rosea]UPY36499.1 LemA family protein [Sediminicoccus rosea]
MLILAVWAGVTHRRLDGLRKAAVEAWPPLEATLRRRHNVVGPLGQRVLALAPKEKAAIAAMIKARGDASMTDLSPVAAGKAELALTSAIVNVMAVSQAYPELAADLEFRRLETELTQREAQIAAAREAFNQAALAFNRAALSGAAILVTKFGGLGMVEYFGLSREEQAAMAAAAGPTFWTRP